jgi:hypothetical protein
MGDGETWETEKVAQTMFAPSLRKGVTMPPVSFFTYPFPIPYLVFAISSETQVRVAGP